jgi:TolA-binding protein
MTQTRRLAEYVVPKLSDARLDAQWARIREREPKPVFFALRYVYAAAALSIVLGLGFFVGRHFGTRAAMQTASSSEPFTVERDAAGQSRLSLPEGITVEIAAGASLQVRGRSAQETTLELGRGRAVFDVTHRDGRRVVVATPGFDIEVVGTRFLVQVSEVKSGATPSTSADVSVEVLRGTVRVNPSQREGSSDQRQSLTTGQRWSSNPSVVSTDVVEGQRSFATASALASAPDASALLEPAKEGRPDLGVAATAEPTLSGSETASSVASAKDLFELAERHRMNGKLREAASALDRLRRNYPGDARAALATFELGRIRMDGLGDATGAISAFQSAIKLNPSGAYREDAEARLVQLYQRLGAIERCRQAKAAYLAKYGQGRYVGTVKGACER